MLRLALALLLLVACSVDPAIAPRDCTPGQTAACACPGASGVQACDATVVLGACQCPDAGSLGDVADVAPARDVALEDRPDVVTAPDVVDAGELVPDAAAPDVVTADLGPAEDARDAGVCPGVDLQGDPRNCGACGNVCTVYPNEVPHCLLGGCSATCTAPFAQCDTNVANGCETNLQADRMNCGRCRNACPGSQVCRNGVCG